MARTIRPRTPAQDLTTFPSVFERLLGEPLASRSVWPSEERQDILVDMYEEDDAIVVRASVPGLKREDLHAEVHGDELRIWGERKEETERKDEDVYLREHRYGRIERRMMLPRDVDADAASAAFRDGVLTLKLPTRGDGDHREIEIEGEG